MFKKKIKQDYVITFVRIDGLVGYEGKEVIIKWRRGKKEANKGKFKPVKVQFEACVLDSDAVVNLHCTLFEKQKSGFYEEKLIEFSVNTCDGKKISSGVIDLAQYVGLNGEYRELEVDMKGKKKANNGKLYGGIVATDGVITGYSENTEVLVLEDESDESNESGLKGELAKRMKEQEEKEEEELRKKQLEERDAMRLASGDYDEGMEDKGSSKKKSRKEKKKEKKEKKDKKKNKKDKPVSPVPIAEIKEEVKQTQPEEVKKEPVIEETTPEEVVAIVEEVSTAIEEVKGDSSSQSSENSQKEEEMEEKKNFDEFMKEKRTIIEIIDYIKGLVKETTIIEGIKVYVERICNNLTPLINGCLFSKRTVEEINTSEVEQITSKVILKTIKNYTDILVEKKYENDMITRMNKQIFHHLSYYVLDFMFEHPENIRCSKGYQLKFFMMYMNMSIMSDDYNIFKKEYEQMNIITDISNVFMQHHCISVDEIPLLFPTLSNNIIHKLLSNFQTDEMDIGGVKKEFLEDLEKKCTTDEIPTRNTFIA